MNSIIRRSPMRNFSDSLLPAVVSEWSDFFPGVIRGSTMSAATKVPAVDIKETETGYQVIADLPGIAKENLQVSVNDNVLSFSVHSEKENTEESDGRIIRQERYQGTFQRSFQLNDTMDGDKIEANYKDGVLSIVVPKKEQLHPKKIEVTVH